MRRRDRLGRRRPYRRPLPRFLIVCEGTQTESGYFNDLRHEEHVPIVLDIRAGGVPKTLVERAVGLKHEAEKNAKRERDNSLRYDHVWCVFDVDDHSHIADAKQQARDNGVQLAISNPCFELWLLHFEDQRSCIDRSAVYRECAKHLPSYGKRIPFEKVHPHYREAVQRASDLAAWQKSRGCDDNTNPWTGVQVLTELILHYGSDARATQL